jgi:DNA adenine methylase
VSTTAEKSLLAKPFLKWAGGKTQLLNEIDKRLPKDAIENGKITKYMEAFLGGGAVFFHVAQRYNKIEHFYLLDVNEDLIGCYGAVRDNVQAVIAELEILKASYFARHTKDSRRELFEDIRTEFNLEKDMHFSLTGIMN